MAPISQRAAETAMRRRFYLITNPGAGLTGSPLLEAVANALLRSGAELTLTQPVDIETARRQVEVHSRQGGGSWTRRTYGAGDTAMLPSLGIRLAVTEIYADVDLPPARHLLVVRNDDRPGMIAAVTAALAEAQVNIDDMRVGHDPDGAAAMQVLATTPEVPEAVREALRAVDGIVSVHALTD